MKPKHKNTPKQWAIMTALTLVGFFAFLLLAGEDTPENPMSLTQFFTIKLIGLALLAGCCKVGQALHRKGMLPEVEDKD